MAKQKTTIIQYERPKIAEPYVATRFRHKMNEPSHEYAGSGTLYLTSGGRIVMDCGWGSECFNEYDTPICTLDQLRHGFYPKQFIELLEKAKDKRGREKLGLNGESV